MVTEIGVFNAAPVYMLGLTKLSSSNRYAFERVEDIANWTRGHPAPVLLVDIRDDDDLKVVVDVTTDHPDSVVVALIDDVSTESVSATFASGASAAISRDSAPADVVFALEAALSGNTVLPLSIAKLLAATRRGSSEPARIGAEELRWLQAFARGATVAGVGEEAGYSEREMYRRLKRLYAKLGVRSRTEALLKVSRLGWIED
jgi:DNA-binding NarL/FixJ family response regulator